MAKSRNAKGGRPPQRLADGSLNPAASASAQFARDEERASRRTSTLVLVGVGAVMVVPLLFRGEAMQRNVYGNHADCVADYSETQCEYVAGSYNTTHIGGRGPWYASEPDPGDKTDPGPGRTRAGVASFSGNAPGNAPMSIERGVRGGFGHTGGVRSAGG